MSGCSGSRLSYITEHSTNSQPCEPDFQILPEERAHTDSPAGVNINAKVLDASILAFPYLMDDNTIACCKIYKKLPAV